MSVVQWFLWIKEKYIHSSVSDYGLSICCGVGTLERHALNLEICSKFDALDISSKSIQAAKEQSIEQGMVDRIDYFVDDLNNINSDHTALQYLRRQSPSPQKYSPNQPHCVNK
jgi:ubiquinone/menaquinone biosynthesis C-methylase UbiE